MNSTNLLSEHKKKLLKELEKNKHKYNQLNNLQLSIKLCINSVYGQMGSPYFPLFDIDNALSVTSCGQTVIKSAFEYLPKVVSGSSADDCIVCGDTDSCRSDSYIRTHRGVFLFEDLWTYYNECETTYSTHGHEIRYPENLKSLSYDSTNKRVKLAPVAKLIRHKVSKSQYKITTSSGKHVIVTGDHSCIIVDNTGNIHKVKASEIKIGDKVIGI